MVLSASPPVLSRAVSSLLNQIATELAQEQNLVRIKKLLLYVCTGIWENERQRLDRAPLDALLQHLFENFLTFEDLQQQLHQVVASLNKPAEYTIVANTIISRFHLVYAAVEQDQPTANQTFCEAVTQRLQQEPDPIRIKKLLLLSCRGFWESDVNQLARLSLSDLIQELHQINPTVEGLQASLFQVAKALSKPAEYTKIAETISNIFQDCWTEEKTELMEPFSETALEVTTKVTTKVTTWLPVSEVIRAPILPTLNEIAERQTCTLENLQQNRDHLSAIKESGIGPSFPTIPSHAGAPKCFEPSRMLVIAPQNTINFFDLRLEMVQDANPLRIKILLFSLLHESFDGSAEHDAFLRTHELDDLLRVLFLSYRLYSEVEIQLNQTALSLSATNYLQVAEAILRAIQPLYIELDPAVEAELISHWLPTIQGAPTEITNMKADTNEITLPDR